MRHNARLLLAAITVDDMDAAKLSAERIAVDAATLHQVDPDRPALLDGVRLDQMSDDALEELVTSNSPVIYDDDALTYVLAEIDHRDQADRTAAEGNILLQSCLAMARRDQGHRSLTKLGRQLDRDWSEAMTGIEHLIFGSGVVPTSKLRQAARSLLGARRQAPPTRREQVAAVDADWRALMAQRYFDAEDVCRGRILNRKSENVGVDPKRLFTENAAWIRAHASREFLDWIADNPRITRSEYLAQAGVATDSQLRQASTARENRGTLVI